MDFISLKKLYKKDPDYPQRTFDLIMFRKVLDGEIYDVLKYPFFQDFRSYGKDSISPITIDKRRPSVRYRLAKIVVDNSVSLLFGEGRFPKVLCDDDLCKEALECLISHSNLRYEMMEAALSGSVGSSAILYKLIEGKPFFESLKTEFLLPKFDPKNPTELLSVKQSYKIKGSDLMEKGYENLEKESIYWFSREWTKDCEIFYVPVLVSDEKKVFKIDKSRTVEHSLGFVPMVWIKNLPGKCGEVDGMCTFRDAIDTNIELDYQMSQAGRGLKYSSEPILMIKNPSLNMRGEIVMGEGNIITVDESGDAKHVEISGDASKAVVEYAKILRETAMENIHGNKSSAEKHSTVQSGKAMEMMNLPLVWLADKLRITYGENGLVKLLNMFVLSNKKNEIIIKDEKIPIGALKDNNISLQWPHWFAQTSDDRLKEANAIKALKDGQIISRETAVTSVASEYDIVDIPQELVKIQHGIDQLQTEQPQIKENIPV